MWRNRSYEPVRRIGIGYQSSVWLAKDTNTNELVTIKAIDIDSLETDRSINHLRNEQRTLELLARELNRPPTTLSIYKFSKKCLRVAKLIKHFHEYKHGMRLLGDTSENGILYFVFEFIPGAPLNKHIARTKGLPEQTTRFYAAELIRIIAALHERGIVYRDLKASNVIVKPNGRIMLIDFGFAKFIGVKGRTRSFCGTLHAMPPEILRKGSIISDTNWDADSASAINETAVQLTIDVPGPISDSIEDRALSNSSVADRLISSTSLGERLMSSNHMGERVMSNASFDSLIESGERSPCASIAPLEFIPLTQIDENQTRYTTGQEACDDDSSRMSDHLVAPPRRKLSRSRNWSSNVLAQDQAHVCDTFNDNPVTPKLFPESPSTPTARRPQPINSFHTSISTPNMGDHLLGYSKSYLYPSDTYGADVDWWSVGIIIYEMIFCRPPFGYYDYSVDRCQTIEQLANKSPESIVFPDSPPISHECKDLIINLLLVNQKLRLGANDDVSSIISHPWFQNFQWNLLDDPDYVSSNIDVYHFDETDY